MPGVHARIQDLPERYQQQVRAQLDHPVAGSPDSEREPDPQDALGRTRSAPVILVDPARPLHVRIVRVGGRTLDDDNLAGGCKELRDAIAAALGRSGDSEVDMLTWTYAQERGEAETRIELTERS